jgi:hypothetical protein
MKNNKTSSSSGCRVLISVADGDMASQLLLLLCALRVATNCGSTLCASIYFAPPDASVGERELIPIAISENLSTHSVE